MVTVLMNGVRILITGRIYNFDLKIILDKRWNNLRMRRLARTFMCCVCLFWCALILPSFAAENPDTIGTSHFSVGIGWEILNYSEHEPDSHLDSKANVSNWTLGLDAFKQWTHIFCGFSGIIPIHRVDNEEDWRVSDIPTQQNALEYGWTRIDVFAGYRLNPFINPYMGLRWSETKQERTGFVVTGKPVGGSATEDVTAWFMVLGIRGDLLLKPRWRLSYSGSYFEPISSKVENTGLPGWEVTNTDGYAFEFEGRTAYAYTDRLSFVFTLYGGQMHWKGSEWAPYANRSIKWPENDTRYLGGMLNVRWSF